ncbi:MAG: DNA polymerase III subunit delta [Ignavibacteriales bacterium CG_4_9_14_3_um_filter_34_10]|nr:MAG: DNA polymerase III subunit delta [Ignavibacteriales bacterium CG_4_9_14_3_um_filter_34_10]
MAKEDIAIESIYNINKYLKKENLLPVYFLFGEDEFTISNAVSLIKKTLSEFILSDFDMEDIELQKSSDINQIVDLAYSFPFSGGKKLITLKNFELLNDKKNFIEYIQNPSEFTFLVITQKGKKIDMREKLNKVLIEKKYLFEARDLNRNELTSWTVSRAAKLNLKINRQNAESLIDFVGEDKSLLEMNLTKFSSFLSENQEITIELIENLASFTKEYNVFNLLDAIIVRDKAKALEIAYSLLDKGDERTISNIVGLLIRFISTVVKIIDISTQKLPFMEAAKIAGVSPYFYKNCEKAVYLRNEEKMRNAIKALLEADISIKSTPLDNKSILSILISKIVQ